MAIRPYRKIGNKKTVRISSIFENQRIVGIDNSDFGGIGQFGFFSSDLIKTVKIKQMNRSNIKKDGDLGLDNGKQIVHIFWRSGGVNAHLYEINFVFLPVGEEFKRSKQGDFKPVKKGKIRGLKTKNRKRNAGFGIGTGISFNFKIGTESGFTGKKGGGFTGRAGNTDNNSVGVFKELKAGEKAEIAEEEKRKK